MNPSPLPEVVRSDHDTPQARLPLATEGVQRYVWEGRFGTMLVEAIDGVAYVNGDRIEPMPGAGSTPAAR